MISLGTHTFTAPFQLIYDTRFPQQAEGIVPWAVNTGPEFIHGAENSPLVDLIRRAGWRTKEYEWPDKYYYTKDNRMLPADTEVDPKAKQCA